MNIDINEFVQRIPTTKRIRNILFDNIGKDVCFCFDEYLQEWSFLLIKKFLVPHISELTRHYVLTAKTIIAINRIDVKVCLDQKATDIYNELVRLELNRLNQNNIIGESYDI